VDGDAEEIDESALIDWNEDGDMTEDDRILQRMILLNFMARQKVSRLSELHKEDRLVTETDSDGLLQSNRFTMAQQKLLGHRLNVDRHK